MKINHLNLQNEKLNQVFRTGQRLLLVTSASLALAGCSFSQKDADLRSNTEVASTAEELKESYVAEVDLEDINQLNIILCNNECNKEIFDATVQKLTEEGIQFTVAEPRDEDILNRSMSTVITLSSTVYRSEHSLILGQYDNQKRSNSDALALAMESGLKHHDIPVDGIRLGITQVESEDGITHRVPTGTELKIAPSSSFVTIALGTQMDPSQSEAISDGIIDGIVRAASDIKENENADYLYRITGVDTIDGMAQDLGTTSSMLKEMNPNLEEDLIQRDDVVRHPDIAGRDAFSEKVEFKTIQNNKSL